MVIWQLIRHRCRLTKSVSAALIFLVSGFSILAIGPFTRATAPQQTLHALHVQEQELDCGDCHTRNVNIQRENCEICHDAADVDGLLATFKAEIAATHVVRPVNELFFDHAKHPAAVGCQQCHQNIETIGSLPLRRNLSMEICLGCHRGTGGPREDCVTCHGTKPIAPPADHAQDFRRSHGAVAEVNLERCSLCHQDRFCQDCHEGENIQGNIHPLNFANTHFFEALGREADCLVCHQSRDECVACHRQNMVLPHALGLNWANSSDGGDHSEEAQANLESCLDCHDLGSADPVCSKPGCHN